MPKRKRFALAATLLAFAALSTPGAAAAAGFDQFIGFGDSTFDTGYFRYNTTGNAQADIVLRQAVGWGNTGAFVGDGVMNSTMLADRFGLTAAPVVNGPNGVVSGTNYANGGAYTTTGGTPIIPANVSTVAQIQLYLATVNNHADPNSLYVVKTGDNDLNFPAGSQSALITYLTQSANALATQTAILQADGARTILVPNSYNCACFADQYGNIPSGDTLKYSNSQWYNAQKWADLQAAGVHFIPADIDSVFKYVVHNPALFGFSSTTMQAVNAPALSNPAPYNSALTTLPLSPMQQQTYLFVDSVHLTTAGQTIEADYEYSLLIAPSEISLLAESVVQGGWARAATIQGQLDPCAQHRGPCGYNVWTSMGTYSSEVRNAPGFASDSGTPFGGTVGLDYQLPGGLILGAAFATGSQSPGFSTNGHYDEVDEAPSLYVAYVAGPWWGNAVATYDAFQDQISRPVQMGIFIDQNNGNTVGHSLALALRGGFDFGLGPITTGPVAGLILQDVQVNGFTETSATGISALSFGDQTRDSLVTQLGWRVCMERGPWRPFLEMDWNHECAGKDRTVTAALTSIAAPAYTMPAAPVVSDWATTSLGAFYEISPRVILRGAASAMYINPQMITCGGEFGLNVCF